MLVVNTCIFCREHLYAGPEGVHQVLVSVQVLQARAKVFNCRAGLRPVLDHTMKSNIIIIIIIIIMMMMIMIIMIMIKMIIIMMIILIKIIISIIMIIIIIIITN